MKKDNTSTFLTIANNPNSSEAQKNTIKELMLFVGESNPDKAYLKLLEQKTIVLYGGNIGGIRKVSLTDLSPFEDFYNLEELILANNQITDIEPLSKLHNLRVLRLDSNKIENIGPLQKLINLRELNLDNNKISDFTPLMELKNIEYFSAQGNFISNLRPIAELTKLTDLILANNQIRDLHALSNLQSITNLQLNQNQIINITSLSNVGKKEIGGTSLNLAGNMIEEISVLSNIKTLTILDLANNNIKSIKPLANLKLVELNLENNNISDIKPLLNIKTLDALNLKGNPIDDKKSISKLENIVSVIHIDNINVFKLFKKSSSTSKKIDHPIIGIWKSEKIESEWGQVLVEIVFKEDGEYIQYLYSLEEQGDPLASKGFYLLEKDELTLESMEDKRIFRFYFKDDSLFLEDESEDTYTRTLKLKRIDSQLH